MSREFSSGENRQLTIEELTQETLIRAVEDELVIEIVDYDFYVPGKSGKENIPERLFEMGQDGDVHITRSPHESKTHKVVLTSVPVENEGMIYLLGFLLEDTSRRDAAQLDISMEYQAQLDVILEEHREGLDKISLYGVGTLEDAQRFSRDMERNSKKYDDESERLYRKITEREREANKIPAVITQEISFAHTAANLVTGKLEAEFNLQNDSETGGLFIPVKPIPFETFKNTEFLQLFLASLAKDREYLDNWSKYFATHKDKFPPQARFAIQSKLQTLVSTNDLK